MYTGLKKLEIGAGPRPTPGYIHNDINQFESLETSINPVGIRVCSSRRSIAPALPSTPFGVNYFLDKGVVRNRMNILSEAMNATVRAYASSWSAFGTASPLLIEPGASEEEFRTHRPHDAHIYCVTPKG